MSKQRTHAGPRPKQADAERPVSKPGDRQEREAERAAEVVARGGSVSSWSFSAVPASAPDPVQRQEVVKEKTDEEKKQEAVKKAGEAALATPQGQAVKEAVLNDPLVKTVKDAVTSTPGLIATGAAAAGGVAALAATGKELPVQPPEIPLDKISKKFEGATAQITYEGPVDKPTFVGLTLTFKEQAPKGRKKGQPSAIAADTARLKAQQELFKPESQKAAEKQEADEWVQAWVAQQRFPGAPAGVTIPLLEPQPGEKKEERKETRPAQPAPALPSSAPPVHAEVDGALSTPGRPLDPTTRRSMEARFGYDFSGVRVHDDARAAAIAADIDAAAFTVGESVVFASGRFDPSSPQGRRLLAHELAHVRQQTRGPSRARGVVQRRSVWEELGILFGFSEGEFTPAELTAYLRKITGDQHIEDDYDSDNKARAIVRRYQTGDFTFDLTAFQKILLVEEMLAGPTQAEDEGEIVALLEVSDNEDLAVMFGPTRGISVRDLESDIGGESRRRLDFFLATRFAGGREALLRGRIEPRGYPGREFERAALTAIIDRGGTTVEIVAHVLALPPVPRERATRFLAGHRADLDRRVTALGRQIADEQDPTARGELRGQRQDAERARHTVDVALQRLYREVVGSQTPGTLRERTIAPARTPEQRTRIHEAQAPERRRDLVTGEAPKFQLKLPGEEKDYEQKLREALPGIVDGYYRRMVEGRGRVEHADPSKSHTLEHMERIANAAKRETDRVFGHLATRPPLRADRPGKRGSIHDLFADYEERLARMGPEERRQVARQQLFYFFATNSDIRTLNDRHNADPSFDSTQRPRNDEARILSRLATEFSDTDAEVTRLHEIKRGWPATATRSGEVNIQLFRRERPEDDRLFLWDMFQTLIHEYMHTLAHARYNEYAASFGYDSTRYNTLIEGVDTLFSETVWVDVEPRANRPDLRNDVEGPEYAGLDAITIPHPEFVRRYASYAEAVRLSEVVGIANLYTAYFLGDVEKIGASG